MQRARVHAGRPQGSLLPYADRVGATLAVALCACGHGCQPLVTNVAVLMKWQNYLHHSRKIWYTVPEISTFQCGLPYYLSLITFWRCYGTIYH